MKIAYLITAFNNYNHLEKLINSLNDENSMFFIHIDKKSEMPQNINPEKNIIFINRHTVWWGGWSHQLAILNLMNEAVKHNLSYYSLISGTDYPIRPKKFLTNKLQEGGEFISLIKGTELDERALRTKYYYFDYFDRRNRKNLKTQLFIIFEKALRGLLVKNTRPFKQIYHGPTWWTLSHNAIIYILEFLEENKEYIKFFKSSFCAEESLIHTIIGNSEFKENCKYYLTYTEWSNKSGPNNINLEHLILFENQLEFEVVEGKYTPYFARKFNDQNSDLISIIDNKLRNA